MGVTRGSDEEFIAFVSSSSPGLLRLAWMLSGSESTAEEMSKTRSRGCIRGGSR